jgi:polar amino acid transport system substrate-binding protein
MKSLLFAASLLLAVPPASLAGEVSVPQPGASSRIDAIKQRGSLRVAVLDEYPWLKQNHSGDGRPFEGGAWRLAEEYARLLGVRLETTFVSFDDKVSIVRDGGVDITVVPLLTTPAREKIVDFVVYSKAAQCLFGRADNPKLAGVDDVSALNRPDITIGFITDTPQGAWLQGRLPAATRDGIPGNVADVAVGEVVARRADVAPIDQYFFSGLAQKTPGLISIPRGDACLASEELTLPIGMAIAKGQPAFIGWLRAVAEAIKPQVDAEHARVVAAGG